MNPNKFNLPFEYCHGEIVIHEEIAYQIVNQQLDYEFIKSFVDQTVAIVDEAILRIGYGK